MLLARSLSSTELRRGINYLPLL